MGSRRHGKTRRETEWAYQRWALTHFEWGGTMTEVSCNKERANDEIIPQLGESRPFHTPRIDHLLEYESVLMPATKGC